MSRPLRVLLWSPLRGVDPASGDVSYTEALLASPPPGVSYTTYRQAIEDGTVRVHGRKPWHGAWDQREMGIFAARSVELGLRAAGVMFREQVQYVSIEAGAYDLMHQHLAAIRQLGPRLPVVSGAGYPLTELYRWREGWSRGHLRLALDLEQRLASLADVHNPWLRPAAGGAMTVYGEHFRSWLIARGVEPDRVHVASTALPDLQIPPKRSTGKTLGLIGHDFALKGGDIALEAFRRLRRADPSWRLVVATHTTAMVEKLRAEEGVDVVIGATRSQVLFEILPTVDILLAPTRADCGAPYGVIEALQSSTAVVLSDLVWLDERLDRPAVWRVARDPSRVAGAVDEICRFGLSEAQSAARELWRSSFSMAPLHAALRAAYDQALSAGPASRRLPDEGRRSSRVKVLVVARPYDLSDASYDGFVIRHRRMVRELCSDFDVHVLLARPEGTDQSHPKIDGVSSWSEVPLPRRDTARMARLLDALRQARGVEGASDHRLVDGAARCRPDAVVTMGPWLGSEYRCLWRRYPSVHLFEEDLDQMIEIAPQSRRARLLREVETAIRNRAPGQPLTVVSISPPECRRARRQYVNAAHAYVPFTLAENQWPVATTMPEGQWVITVGNFAEPRNARGLFEVLAELDRRGSDLPLRIISGPGLHPELQLFLRRWWVDYPGPVASVRPLYQDAWAALVPARRLTGQKTTILQAWSCRVPVVCSPEAAASVDAAGAVLVGADATQLVDQLLTLREHSQLRRRYVEAGVELLGTRFDASEEEPTLRRLIHAALRRWSHQPSRQAFNGGPAGP